MRLGDFGHDGARGPGFGEATNAQSGSIGNVPFPIRQDSV
jgi:hypothetical protein